MFTENEIHDASLEKRQKMWLDLKTVGSKDPGFANAKALLGVIEGSKKWKPPEPVKVKVARDFSRHVGPEREATHKAGEEIAIYPWEFSTFYRFLDDEDENVKAFASKLSVKNQERLDDEKRSKGGAGGAAALIALLFCLFFASAARAQVTDGAVANTNANRVGNTWATPAQFRPTALSVTNEGFPGAAAILNNNVITNQAIALNGGTNQIIAGQTNIYAMLIPNVTRASSISLQVNSANVGAENKATLWQLGYSDDGSNIVTTDPTYSFTNRTTGTAVGAGLWATNYFPHAYLYFWSGLSSNATFAVSNIGVVAFTSGAK